MSLKDYSKEELQSTSLVDLAALLLIDEKNGLKFTELYDKIAELKGLSEEAKAEKVGQFSPDLNMDGNFITKGSNVWALKRFNREWKNKEVEEAIVE